MQTLTFWHGIKAKLHLLLSAIFVTAMLAVTMLVAGLPFSGAASAAPTSIVQSAYPTAAELTNQVRLLVASGASDASKAAQLEGGQRAVIVPRTIYGLGIFRSPRGSGTVMGPLTKSGDQLTAYIHARSSGIPTIKILATWKRKGGQWKLANKTLCAGVKAVGLRIACNF